MEFLHSSSSLFFFLPSPLYLPWGFFPLLSRDELVVLFVDYFCLSVLPLLPHLAAVSERSSPLF